MPITGSGIGSAVVRRYRFCPTRQFFGDKLSRSDRVITALLESHSRQAVVIAVTDRRARRNALMQISFRPRSVRRVDDYRQIARAAAVAVCPFVRHLQLATHL